MKSTLLSCDRVTFMRRLMQRSDAAFHREPFHLDGGGWFRDNVMTMQSLIEVAGKHDGIRTGADITAATDTRPAERDAPAWRV